MSEINLSSAVRNSLTSLQATADLLTTTQERLATGNRVNSALDDPTAFFTASALNNRAADLSTLLDAEQQAIRTVEVADDAISAIEDLVSSARAQANAALQTEDLGARATAAQAFDDILAQIELLAGDASFNGTNLLEGDDLQVVFNEDGSSSLTVEGFNFTNTSTGLGLDRQSQTASATPSTGTINFADLAGDETLTIDVDGAGATTAVDIDLSLIATGATPAVPSAVETALFDVADVNNTDTFSIAGFDGSGAPQTLNVTIGGGGTNDFADPADQAALVTSLQTQADAVFGAGNVTIADSSPSGQLVITSTTGDVAFTYTDVDNSGATNNANSTSSPGATAFEAAVPGTLDVNDVVDAIDAAFGGTSGLTVVEAGGNISLTSTAGDFAVSGAATVAGTGFVAGNGTDFATDTAINDTLAAIDTALATLRSSAGSLGADLSTIQVRQDFTAALINTLEGGAGDLTLADLNEEGANLLTLQTRQQLASTSLSFATQADQSVLSLFG